MTARFLKTLLVVTALLSASALCNAQSTTALFDTGMLLRVNIVPRFSQNLLDSPVPAGQQVYIGQRPTFISGVNPIFTADLRQLGLRQAQLRVAFGWRYTNWKPAGPNTLAMTSLYFFKRWEIGGSR